MVCDRDMRIFFLSVEICFTFCYEIRAHWGGFLGGAPKVFPIWIWSGWGVFQHKMRFQVDSTIFHYCDPPPKTDMVTIWGSKNRLFGVKMSISQKLLEMVPRWWRMTLVTQIDPNRPIFHSRPPPHPVPWPRSEQWSRSKSVVRTSKSGSEG